MEPAARAAAGTRRPRVARTSSARRLQLHFRVRPLLVRWLVSVLTLVVTVVLVPHVSFSGSHRVLSYLIIAAVFALLNAFIKPLFQLLLLPFIFVSYGLVVVLINTGIFWLLSVIFPARFHVQTFIWALAAGAVSGAIYALLENLLGLAPPILQDKPPDFQEQAQLSSAGIVGAGLLAATSHGREADDVALAAAPAQTLSPAGRSEETGAGAPEEPGS
jgi:putative membrane protein